MNGMKILWTLLALCTAALPSCTQKEQKPQAHRMQAVTTLFPVYDFTRQIGGDKVDVRLLLPPGVEPHSFEPKPDDIVRINRADLFIFTNKQMEPWAENILKGVAPGKLSVVEAGDGAAYLPTAEAPEEGGRHDHHKKHGDHETLDPHIWLSIPNAQAMVNNIAAALARKDPANRDFYMANAAGYGRRLAELDDRFRKGLADCQTKNFMHGGHYAFGYLAKRYGLNYRSAYALSANSEPSPKKLVDLVNEMKRHGLRTIFYEELISPAMAQAIARETGAELIKLHGIHNVSKTEVESGATYLSLMEQNLANLRKGLGCR